MELEQLRYFLKVAERANFTHAAEELGMSQSALSRAVAKLEEELGQPVFERQSRAVVLTDAGQMLQKRALQIVTLVADTQAELTDEPTRGRVRLAAIPTIAPYFLPPWLCRFSQRFPEAHIWVQEDTTDRLLQLCNQGEIDLAILALPIAERQLRVEPLFTEELFLILPTGHPLLARDTITLDDVKPFPFILLDEAHCLTGTILTFCRQRDFQPITVGRTSQLAMVQELVALGYGLSLVPALARQQDDSPRRVYRSLAGQPPTRQVVLVWNPDRFQRKLVESVKVDLRDYTSGE